MDACQLLGVLFELTGSDPRTVSVLWNWADCRVLGEARHAHGSERRQRHTTTLDDRVRRPRRTIGQGMLALAHVYHCRGSVFRLEVCKTFGKAERVVALATMLLGIKSHTAVVVDRSHYSSRNALGGVVLDAFIFRGRPKEIQEARGRRDWGGSKQDGRQTHGKSRSHHYLRLRW